MSKKPKQLPKKKAASTTTGSSRVRVNEKMGGFTGFIREQGVVGLAVGLVLGTAVKEVVDTIVKAFIDPLVGLIVPNATSLATAKFTVDGKDFLWGLFVSVLIRFVAIAAVVYFVAQKFVEKFDRKKP